MGKLEILVNGESTFTSEDTTEVSITGNTGAVALIEVPNDEKTVFNIRTNGTLDKAGSSKTSSKSSDTSDSSSKKS